MLKYVVKEDDINSFLAVLGQQEMRATVAILLVENFKRLLSTPLNESTEEAENGAKT